VSHPLFTKSLGSGADNVEKMRWHPIMDEPACVVDDEASHVQVYWQIIHQNDGMQASVGLLGKTSGRKELIT
jgi:hypothetical protein